MFAKLLSPQGCFRDPKALLTECSMRGRFEVSGRLRLRKEFSPQGNPLVCPAFSPVFSPLFAVVSPVFLRILAGLTVSALVVG